jgi:hypothetical protein
VRLDSHSSQGPFTYRDTTGGPQVATIYLSAFYFCLTSMTSVGFGDITGRNDDERVFSVVLEFIGAGVLATCVASMTAVVTAQDMNSRKTAEQLDAVASFVISKNFPENLGRRIRRHFRHVYSIKTAIDESKIFTELSTSLRAEVSAYLLENKMGQVTLFRSMSRTLWPRLLPMLRPVHFERADLICAQGEDVTEMFVVLSGMLSGITVIIDEDDDEIEDGNGNDEDAGADGQNNNNNNNNNNNKKPLIKKSAKSPVASPVAQKTAAATAAATRRQSRRILPGGAVNILTVIGVWDKAVETVQTVHPAETYALSQVGRWCT